jgi:hypothetical protein
MYEYPNLNTPIRVYVFKVYDHNFALQILNVTF